LRGAENYLEEALKIYHKLAQKERQTYLPYVATTLNNLGIIDSGKNRVNEARKEYAEALKIFRELAQKQPETYLPHVAVTLNDLGIFDSDKNQINKTRMEYEGLKICAVNFGLPRQPELVRRIG
jgi:tetratricopeptide (TPR) repeat protein